jgi:hypothetical protein
MTTTQQVSTGRDPKVAGVLVGARGHEGRVAATERVSLAQWRPGHTILSSKRTGGKGSFGGCWAAGRPMWTVGQSPTRSWRACDLGLPDCVRLVVGPSW